ncbi:hypothetical protein G7054_g11321 [Neopestalotiopsis clavispora]|nr:hypothetical protein G7054_g11321 [Neopestalotiopsis clavispora]
MVKLIAFVAIALAGIVAADTVMKNGNEARNKVQKRANVDEAWGYDVYHSASEVDRELDERNVKSSSPLRRRASGRGRGGRGGRRGLVTRYRPAGNVGGSYHEEINAQLDWNDQSTDESKSTDEKRFATPVNKTACPQ